MSINVQLLKRLRKEHRYSQASLGKAAGVPSATIAAIEAGRSKDPSYTTVAAIAKVLQVDPDSLFLAESLKTLS